ncbi:2-oxoglutarate dehydrogenase complex dihydrolipoyllysine-residue succinyltransferase [Candidatus Pelagibacter bacterium]|nr:2-oxoglutarate dehydrogenase complex dihydrolipoyllysine-residue succinyltransferase [Candidatus Pelagibacter bacterium]MDC0447803.1 2-oxoglutarate dehydrogenase complex dihydrolipoyllysine-residue succinyltransferase [Pelagibacteraceae bacterium]
MAEKITVPTLGESVTEATVSKWLKLKGEKVAADEPLVELETDKVNVEVPSPISGILGSISVKEGETVNVGSLLGTVENSSANLEKNNKEINNYSPPEKEKPKLKIFEEEKILKPKKIKEKKLEEPKLILDDEEPLILEQIHEDKTSQKIQKQISPAARKMASEANVDLSTIEGSGKNGVILKEDLMSLMGSKPSPSERKVKYGPEERVKMTRLRLTIAKRLKEAQENAAMLTTFNEVDMSEVMSMRSQYKEEFLNKYGVKLGFMSFFVKACVIGLKNYPAINAEIQGEEIVYKNYYNVSIAVGTERGLVVPVLKETDEMSFADIEKNIGDLGQKAREGKITIEDLQGGTFTITNGGIYGSMLSTPILNPPQSAVLGMHNIIQRPVVVDGNVEIRPVMYLALSYDHRIIDGKEAVSFLKIVKESLEQPQRLFLNI